MKQATDLIRGIGLLALITEIVTNKQNANFLTGMSQSVEEGIILMERIQDWDRYASRFVD